MTNFLGRLRHVLDMQVLAALAVTVGVELGLRACTVPRLARLLGVGLGSAEPDLPLPVPGGLAPEWIRRRHAAVDVVFRHWPFGDTCLRRALVLGHRVRRLGPVLVIGVRHDEDARVAAHAWLVIEGRSLDPLSVHYSPLPGPAGS